MTEDEAILRAIAANPAEDTPRLAYADWLDEHDRPHEAELIRVQCAIAGLDSSSAEVRNQNVHLWRRQQDLLEFQRSELLGPLAEVVKPLDTVFDRGFLSEITLQGKAFLTHGESLTRFQPPPVIRVETNATDLSEIVRHPTAPQIDILQVENPDQHVFEWPNDLLSPILRILRSWNLQSLMLEACGINDDDLSILTYEDQTCLPMLQKLDLSHNAITDEGIRTLVASPVFGRITALHLGSNPITDESAQRLAQTAGRLKFLNVANTAITAMGQHALLRRKGTKVDLF